MVEDTKILTIEELIDNEEICDYCDADPEIRCYGGDPVMCEGAWCDTAYERYVDNRKDEISEMDLIW